MTRIGSSGGKHATGIVEGRDSTLAPGGDAEGASRKHATPVHVVFAEPKSALTGLAMRGATGTAFEHEYETCAVVIEAKRQS